MKRRLAVFDGLDENLQSTLGTTREQVSLVRSHSDLHSEDEGEALSTVRARQNLRDALCSPRVAAVGKRPCCAAARPTATAQRRVA